MEFFFPQGAGPPALATEGKRSSTARTSACARASLAWASTFSAEPAAPASGGFLCVVQAARLVSRATSCMMHDASLAPAPHHLSEMIHLPAAGIAGPPVAPPPSAPDESYRRAPRPSFAPCVTPEVQLGPSTPSCSRWGGFRVAALRLGHPAAGTPSAATTGEPPTTLAEGTRCG